MNFIFEDEDTTEDTPVKKKKRKKKRNQKRRRRNDEYYDDVPNLRINITVEPEESQENIREKEWWEVYDRWIKKELI